MNTRDRIIEILNNHPGGLTVEELSEQMNWDSHDLKVSLERMSYKGKVSKDTEQRWKVN